MPAKRLIDKDDFTQRLTEIMEELCHNTMGNPPYRIDIAITAILTAIRADVEGMKTRSGIFNEAEIIRNKAIDDVLAKLK